MGDDIRYRPSRVLAPLLASAAILLMGTAFCVAIILAFGEAKPVPVAIAVGSGLGVGILLWLLRDRPTAEKRGWFAWIAGRKPVDEQELYRVAVIRHKHGLGERRPPTLEELREIKDPTRTWVPRGGTGRQPPPGDGDSSSAERPPP